MIKYLRNSLSRILNYPLSIYVILFIVAFSLRAYALYLPRGHLSDEAYYIPAALSILETGEDPNYVHPPFGKYLIAISFFIFGDNPLGWRFFSVLLGSLAIPLIYFFGKKIYGNIVGMMAAAFLAIDPMAFRMSSLAMLDVFLMFFILLGFIFLFEEKYVFSSFAFGLACGVKFIGAFGIIGALIYLAFRRKIVHAPKFILIPIVLVIACYLPFMISKGFSEWTKELMFVFNWHITLREHHPSASSPLGWLFGITPFLVADGENPVFATANPFLYPLAIPFSAYMLINYRKKKLNMAYVLPIIWFIATYLPFIILPRTTQYIFYLLPSVPAILLIVSYGINLILKKILFEY